MPYKVRKRKCKKSDGTHGTHVVSYVDKRGKHHSSCNSSEGGAKAQIAAIERSKHESVSVDELILLIQEEIEAYDFKDE